MVVQAEVKKENQQENQETQNESKDKGTQEDINTESQQTNEQNQESGREDTNTGEDDQQDESQSSETESQVDPRDEKISGLETQLKELTAKVNAPAPAPKPEPPKAWGETEWTAHSDLTGLSKEATQYFGKGLASIHAVMENRVAEVLSRLSRFEKDSVVRQMSTEKDFADIANYSEGIDTYLKKYDVSYHSDRSMLEDAYFNAKGRGADHKAKKIINSNEVNRKVITKAKMQTPQGGKTGGGTSANLKLSGTEEQAWTSFARHTFKSREDYAKSLPRNKGKK